MPYSLDEGKDWARKILAEMEIWTAVDVGAGAGAWGKLLRETCPRIYIAGVEIWAPYVKQFGLERIYDNVVVADARWLDWTDLPGFGRSCDLVVFGDVLEHLVRTSAVVLVHRALDFARWALISLPIVRWEQGPQEGNPYETHLHHWTDPEVRDTFNVTDSFVGEQVGVYLVTL